MNEHALGVLEYDKVVAMLVERTSFGLGSERAVRLKPTVDLASIREDLLRTTELRGRLDDGERLPLDGAADVRAQLARSETLGAALSCEELIQLRHTLLAAARVKAYLSARAEVLRALWALGERLEGAEDLSESIDRIVDEASLEVRDNASRELSRIRRSMERTREKIDDKLQAILTREMSRDTIQEPAVHMRNGRHVLPVKRAAGSRLKGIVHDESGSGATIFVEPLETVELNNELAGLAAAEKKEVERILRDITARVGVKAGALRESLSALAELDYVQASARLSRDLGGACPDLNTEGRIRIRGGRHPILLQMMEKRGGGVVPLDLDLGEDGTTLVVSGPNAGGKTVTLKTVGLLVLMAQSGLHVPAAPDTELPVVRDIYADIGDEQSIEQNLSTFSSHLRVISEILDEAGSSTLVLIDEMGAGTDPDEGAGLAIAILEDLTARGVPTIATTHLGSVKNHVHDTPGMVNASMAFDPETLEPSFRFVPGIPGASHALSIAESLGLPRSVLDRARELRDDEAAAVDGLLADLVERERKLEHLLDEAERDRRAAELSMKEWEKRLAGVRDERKELKARALAEARATLERAQSLVEETVKEIRAKEAARESIKRAREKLSARRAEIAREIEQEVRKAEPEPGRVPSALTPGMRVRVAGLRREGELLDLPDDKGNVRVRMGNATLEVGSDTLRESVEGVVERKAEISFEVESPEHPPNELHLRGVTTDEVRDLIERYVSAALLHGMTSIRIVHGKGTGALRAETHAVLRKMPSVKSFRLGRWGEGDTGVTIVELG